MKNKKTGFSFSGKGYYIALILCAVAIGISGYLYYRNLNPKQPDPVPVVNPTNPGDIQAISTDPTLPNGGSSDPKPTAPAKKPGKTGVPVSGNTVAEYSMDCLAYNPTTRDWRVHDGMDIAAEAGTTVCAAADGTVFTVYDDDTMGTTVVIKHDGGYVTQYSSLSKELSVAPGDKVTMGQAIGKVGSTALLESAIGDHVHFSVRCNDQVVDPMKFLGES